MKAKRAVTPADILLSAGVFAVYLPYVHARGYVIPSVVLGALSAIALLGKKRFPVPSLVICLIFSGFLAVLLKRSYPATPADLVALYAVGRYCGRGTALTTAIATLILGFAVAEISKNVPSYNFQNLGTLATVPFAVLAGTWVRTQRTYVLGAEERAERAEREREDEARRRVTEERLRIARELHDIVGHALMSISVTSSVSARFVEDDPKAGREALETINTVSNSALGEIRRTLSLLRGIAEPLKRPGLGLADLDELIQQSRTDGLPVTLHESGRRTEIPAIVGFTVYRIVQESLTNIKRHAERVTKVAVTLTFTPDSLDVAVTNDGDPVDVVDRGSYGLGIQGMRERVVATGGRLNTTALPGGGFRVHARLPLKEARP
ncbi:sensor histidine kinase [Actinomadura sp. DC4]|uniref:sensor histidine kinase n=1 Tax=Actinomadura sp. DC4 TaxID=3055069 RepID=UPI0025B14C34|nr:sensor histidine kinase [Actinomadura sp. DC4]MDN3354600.1 sensor histidine kinase [Actinomadura sp. DC4]